MSVLRISIPAGALLPWHRHPVINTGVLLSGRLRVIADNGRSIELKAGDGLIEVVNRSHRGISLGPDPAVILVVYAGARGLPLSVPTAPHQPAL